MLLVKDVGDMLSLEKSMPLLGLAPAKIPYGACGDISTLLSTSNVSQLSTLGLESMYVLLNGCTGIPSLQCLGLPCGTLACACYQGFPAAPAPAQACTAIATATIPTVTAITNGYAQQPLVTATLSQQTPNNSFHATTVLPTGQLNGQTLMQTYPQQQNVFARGPSPGFQKFRPVRSLSGFHPKGLKRKADDALSTDSGDSGNGKSEGSTSSSGGVFLPLFCKVCRVTLNAPTQAKQHYEGKSHAKKVKLTDCSNNNSSNSSNGNNNSTSASSTGSSNGSSSGGRTTSPASPVSNSQASPGAPSSPKEAAPAPPEINPEIYCKLCGVSFNSTKQAQQHYKGKNHAKKIRVTDGDKGRNGYRRGYRYRCYLCNIHLGSKEHLLVHLRGERHQEKLKAQGGTGLGALGGKWTHQNHDVPNGVPFGITQLSRNFQRYDTLYHLGGATSIMPRAGLDFSMHRTPSGRFYCPTCNITLNSEILFAQHIESRRHKLEGTTQRTKPLDVSNSSNNNNNNNNKNKEEIIKTTSTTSENS